MAASLGRLRPSGLGLGKESRREPWRWAISKSGRASAQLQGRQCHAAAPAPPSQIDAEASCLLRQLVWPNRWYQAIQALHALRLPNIKVWAAAGCERG